MDRERENNSSWCCDRIEELIKEFTHATKNEFEKFLIVI